MIVRTIDGINHSHNGCVGRPQGAWLHVTQGKRWVASYLRCAVRGDWSSLGNEWF